LQKLSAEELERSIVDTFDSIQKGNWEEKRALTWALSERQRRLDRTFVWTPDAVQRIVYINNLIIDCIERLAKEAEALYEVLEKRKESDADSFLHDYGIECRMVPIYSSDNEEAERLFSVLDNIELEFSYNGNSKSSSNLFFSSESWANDTALYMRKEFADVRINYALHCLMDHAHCSIKDILNIKELWGEVIVTHQHFISPYAMF
jgi:hypothetical protein